ncbi:MAG: hypothetical protein HOP12_01580 [Candidatus Eisenbacteria bacterium]|uniref:FlgD/Vpr Ig-like domain-containing protein n=1 Tax=Eiseniibacteriota bacterium TaxID=2212470 RepID=A0A849SUG0_UNCEI|nr:hypothetical protein [Candidatus Eisenbacteria bacterium]
MRFKIAVPLVLSAVFVAASAEAAANSVWDAALGALPDSACWTRFDTAPLSDPVLAAGKMTLATNIRAEVLYFEQSGPLLSVPALWVMETGLRVVAESHDPGPRWGATIGFARSAGVGNVLLLGVGQIMLWGGFGVEGPLVAIPTTDRVHDYRVEVEVLGTIRVYQDGQLVLTGASISNPLFGATPYVYFGDGGSSGSSTTEWTYFKHNGAASPCQAQVGVEDVAFGTTIALESPSPNPASAEVLLRFALQREAWLELTIFDVAGRRVRTLESALRPPGEHQARWDLSNDAGRPVKAGVYFARLEAEGRHIVRRLAVTR